MALIGGGAHIDFRNTEGQVICVYEWVRLWIYVAPLCTPRRTQIADGHAQGGLPVERGECADAAGAGRYGEFAPAYFALSTFLTIRKADLVL